MVFHHERFIHAFHVVDDHLNLFRIDILAGSAQNRIVQTAFDVVIAILVHCGNISCAEPAILVQHLDGALWIFVIAHHHIVATAHNLALASLVVHIIQAYLHFVGSYTDGAQTFALVHHHIADERSCFREAIAHCIREAALDEKLFDFRIKFGSADAKEAQLASEGADQFLADKPIQNPWQMLIHPRQQTAFCDSRHNAVMVYLFDDKRHRQHNSGFHLMHSWKQQRRCGRFRQVIAACSHIHGV